MRKRSRVNHPPDIGLPADNRSVVAPIYQTVKFEFGSVEETLKNLRGERPGFFYTRSSNPTTQQLERTIAELQGREDAIVCASGVGAVAQALLALTKQGDHLLCFVETYGPTRHLIRRVLGRYGVTHTMLSIEDTEGIEQALASRPTRLVIFESPTNPVTKIADVEAITAAAHRHGALAVMDNTFGGLHQHGEFAVDVFLHSLTKFASGAGDVLGGALIADAGLVSELRGEFTLLGGTLDPHAAWLIQRGLKTYFLRYREQSATAMQVAELLAAHPAVTRVHYPGLASHPRHELAARQMREFGSIVSFDMAGGAEAGRRFAEALELFALTASLGSTESLVMAPQMMGARELTPEQRRISGVTEGTVRLSIGLEDPDDLLEDVTHALDATRS